MMDRHIVVFVLAPLTLAAIPREVHRLSLAVVFVLLSTVAALLPVRWPYHRRTHVLYEVYPLPA